MHWQERENRARRLVDTGFTWKEAWAAIDHAIAAEEAKRLISFSGPDRGLAELIRDKEEREMTGRSYYLSCPNLYRVQDAGVREPRRLELALQIAPYLAKLRMMAPGLRVAVSGSVSQDDIVFIHSCNGEMVVIVDEFGSVWPQQNAAEATPQLASGEDFGEAEE